MATSNAEPLFIHNDWLSRIELTAFDAETSSDAALTGQSVTASLAATANGSAIDPSLSAAMTEGVPGDYSATFAATALAAHLASLVGTVIYERFVSSDGALDVARPRLVVDQRYGG